MDTDLFSFTIGNQSKVEEKAESMGKQIGIALERACASAMPKGRPIKNRNPNHWCKPEIFASQEAQPKT